MNAAVKASLELLAVGAGHGRSVVLTGDECQALFAEMERLQGEADEARSEFSRLSGEVAGLRRDLADVEGKVDGQAWDDLTAERDELAAQVQRVNVVKLVRTDDGTWVALADDLKAALNGDPS